MENQILAALKAQLNKQQYGAPIGPKPDPITQIKRDWQRQMVVPQDDEDDAQYQRRLKEASPIHQALRQQAGTLEHAMESVRTTRKLSERDYESVRTWLYFNGGANAQIPTNKLAEAVRRVKSGDIQKFRSENLGRAAKAAIQAKQVPKATVQAMQAVERLNQKEDSDPGKLRSRSQEAGALLNMPRVQQAANDPAGRVVLDRASDGKVMTGDLIALRRLARTSPGPLVDEFAQPPSDDDLMIRQIEQEMKARGIRTMGASPMHGASMVLSGLRRMVGGVAAPKVLGELQTAADSINLYIGQTAGMDRKQRAAFLAEKGLKEGHWIYDRVMRGEKFSREAVKDIQRMFGDIAVGMFGGELRLAGMGATAGKAAQLNQAATQIDRYNDLLPIVRGATVGFDETATEEEKMNAIGDAAGNLLLGTQGGRAILGAPFRAAGKAVAKVAEPYVPTIAAAAALKTTRAKIDAPLPRGAKVVQSGSVEPKVSGRNVSTVDARNLPKITEALSKRRNVGIKGEGKSGADLQRDPPHGRATGDEPKAQARPADQPNVLAGLTDEQIQTELAATEKKLREIATLDVGPRNPTEFLPAGEKKRYDDLVKEKARRGENPAGKPNVPEIPDSSKKEPWQQSIEDHVWGENIIPGGATTERALTQKMNEWKKLRDQGADVEDAYAESIKRVMRFKGHKPAVQQALKDGKLSADEYNKLHAGTYGKLEDFAPEVKQDLPKPPKIADNVKQDGREGTGTNLPGSKPAEDVGGAPAKQPVGDVPEQPGRGVSAEAEPGGGAGKRPGSGEGAAEGRTDLPAERGGPAEPIRESNRFRDRSDDIVARTDAPKRDNLVNAVRTLRELESSGRVPTPEEKLALQKFPGWGWTGNRLNPDRSAEPFYKAIAENLSEAEMHAARRATLNSHYTDPAVVDAVWKGLDRLGFKQGKALEPSAGTGLFISRSPKEVEWNAVELDDLTGRILKRIHGQEEKVHIGGYEETPFRQYDAAISNVPFGDYKVGDRNFNTRVPGSDKWRIHNYFLARMVDETRPGGVVAAISTHGSLDAGDAQALAFREWVGGRAELVGAIRLPNNAFKGNAATDVTTDILFFRKLADGETADTSWTQLGKIQTPQGEVTISKYFIDHPEMVLGEHSLTGTMHQRNEYTVLPKGGDLAAQIDELIRKLPENVYREGKLGDFDSGSKVEQLKGRQRAGTLFMEDGQLKTIGLTQKGKRATFGQSVNVELPASQAARVKSYIPLRDSTIALIQQMRSGVDDKGLKALQGDLKAKYEAFVNEFGPLHLSANSKPWITDPDAYTILNLEVWDAETKTVKKLSPLFTERVIDPVREITSVSTASDAVVASLHQAGKVDVALMAKMTGKTQKELRKELAGIIFDDPLLKRPVTLDELVSGNVRKKLKVAQEKGDELAVKELEKAQPEWVKPADIRVNPGASWVPNDVYQQFVADMLEVPTTSVRVIKQSVKGSLTVEEKFYAPGFSGVNATRTYGTARRDFMKLLNDMVNGQEPAIYDKVDDKRVLNPGETELAKDKLQQIRNAWDDWVFANPERMTRLENIYNNEVNVFAERKFDGSHLTLPGMNPKFTDRQHRKNAIWRIMQSDSTLLAHDVGTGKTATMQGASMELRRVGLSKKPMHVTRDGTTEQYASEFQDAYPGAKLLVATKSNFDSKNRANFLAQAINGDWDAIILPHSMFTEISPTPEALRKFYDIQINELRDWIYANKSASRYDKESRTVKDAEKALLKLESKVEKIMDDVGRRQKGAVYWEDLGVDSLFVDEAHNWKNLFLVSDLDGMAQEGSQRAFDGLVKINLLQEMNAKVVFATGTPLSNSLAEFHTLFRFLAPKTLEEQNISAFDDWAKSFATMVTEFERTVAGNYKSKTRLSRFSNVPEMLQLWRQIADVVHADDVKGVDGLPVLKRPDLADLDGNVTKAPMVVASRPTQAQIDYWKTLSERAKVPYNEMRENGDNMLAISTDGRKSTIDLRLADPKAPDDPNSKINQVVANVFKVYGKYTKERAAQMVFLDFGVPGGSTFDLYADIKKKLVKLGIPEKEIAFWQSAKGDTAKKSLMDKINSGQVRVVIGSTEGMGEGVNAQERLVAIHHVNAGWKPANMDQRDGRIIRQGNTFTKVHSFHYVTEDSFDSFMWGNIRRKGNFIRQVMDGSAGREIEDIDEGSLSYSAAEIEAVASGDPRISEFLKLQKDIADMNRLKDAHRRNQTSMRAEVQRAESNLSKMERDLPMAEATAKRARAQKKVSFEFGGELVEKPKDIGLAVLSKAKGVDFDGQSATVARMDGFTLKVIHQNGYPYAILEDVENMHRVPVNISEAVNSATPETVAPGIGRRLNEGLTALLDRPESIRKSIARSESELEKLKGQIGEDFPKQAALEKMEARRADLREQMGMDKDGLDTSWGGSFDGAQYSKSRGKLPGPDTGNRFDNGVKGAGPQTHTAIDRARALGATDADLSKSLSAIDTPELIATRFVSAKLAENPTIDDMSPERIQLRKELLDEYLTRQHFYVEGNEKRFFKPKAEGKAFIVTGLPASGKSTAAVNKILKDHGAFLIDSDDFKAQFPEFEDGFGASRVHEESSLLAGQAFNATVDSGTNIVLPILGWKEESIRRWMSLFGNAYDVTLIYVHIDNEESQKRAWARFVKGGQGYVPPEMIADLKNGPENAYNKVKGEFYGYARYDNTGSAIHLTEEHAGRAGVGPGGIQSPYARRAATTESGSEFEGSGGTFESDVPVAPKDRPGAQRAQAKPRGNPSARIPVEPITGGQPKNLREIIFDVSDAIQNPIRRMKMGAKVEGEYDPKSAAIKIRFSGDLDNTAHEIAHYIADEVGLFAQYMQKGRRSPWDAELAQFWVHGSVASSGPRSLLSYKRDEGFAEFIRAFVVNPDAAKEAAPRFYNHLLTKLPKETWDQLAAFSKDVRSWAGLSSSDKILANTSLTKSQKKVSEKLLENLQGSGYDFSITGIDKFRTQFQDSLYPVVKGIEFARQFGDDLLPVDDPLVHLRLFQGLNGKVGNVLEHGMVNTKMERVTPGGTDWLLEPIMKDASRAEELRGKGIAYMIAERTVAEAKRIEELRAENELAKAAGEKMKKDRFANPDRITGIGAGIYADDALAKKAMADFGKDPDLPVLIEFARRYRQWSDSLLRYMVDSGRMSKDNYANIMALDIPYVALHRVFEGMDASLTKLPSSRKVLGTAKNPIQAFHGSTREIRDPLESLIDQTWAIIKEADRNKVMRSFVDMLELDRGMHEGAAAKLNLVGVRAQSGDKNTIRIFRDGKEEHWQFEENIYRSLKALGESDVPNYLDLAMRMPARILRSGIVYSPPFLVRNIQRDSFDRAVKSRTGSGILGAFKVQTAEEKEFFELYGGSQAGHYFDSEDGHRKALAAAMKQHKRGSVFMLPGQAVNAWKNFSELSETRGRMAEFKSAYKHATEVLGYDHENAALFAAREARDLIDYAVAGSVMRWVNRYIPFTNPAIQGLDRFTRGMMEDPRGFMGRWALYVGIPTVAVWGWNASQGPETMEEYESMPAHLKDLFWNIKIGPNLWLRIPKPFELGAMASGIDRGLSMLRGNKRAYEGYAGSLAKAFLPVDETDLFGPYRGVTENMMNYDMFRRKNIVPPYEERLALEIREGTKNGSRLAQAIQNLINVDSRKVDHFIGTQLGTLGRMTTDVSNIGREDRPYTLADAASSVLGMTARSPAYNSPDVQFVLQAESEAEIHHTRQSLKPLMDQYFAAKTDAERDRLARELRSLAKRTREWIEMIYRSNPGSKVRALQDAYKPAEPRRNSVRNPVAPTLTMR